MLELLNKHLSILIFVIFLLAFIIDYFLPFFTSWKGVLVKRRKRFFSTGDYIFIFKTNKGKRIVITSWYLDYRYSYDKSFYDWKIGDKFVKIKGEFLPRRKEKTN